MFRAPAGKAIWRPTAAETLSRSSASLIKAGVERPTIWNSTEKEGINGAFAKRSTFRTRADGIDLITDPATARIRFKIVSSLCRAGNLGVALRTTLNEENES